MIIKKSEFDELKKIKDDEYYFLIASLLESADKVANTASVYGAFLKKIKKTAQKNLVLSPAYFETSSHASEVYQEDANRLIEKISGDILYLDPPYNNRHYGANYHLLNTIAYYDDFVPKGKTGLRDYFKSPYCMKALVRNALDELIKKARFKYIFLSYNNEGLLDQETIKGIFSKYGRYSFKEKKYQRFKADKDENREHKAIETYEHLHILEKQL